MIIPDTAKEKPQEGQVIAVGRRQDDGKVVSLDVKPATKRRVSGRPAAYHRGDDRGKTREEEEMPAMPPPGDDF